MICLYNTYNDIIDIREILVNGCYGERCIQNDISREKDIGVVCQYGRIAFTEWKRSVAST